MLTRSLFRQWFRPQFSFFWIFSDAEILGASLLINTKPDQTFLSMLLFTWTWTNNDNIFILYTLKHVTILVFKSLKRAWRGKLSIMSGLKLSKMYGNISRHWLMDVCVELISPGGLLRIDCLTTSLLGTPTCWNLLDRSSRNHSPVTTFSSLWQQVTHRQHCVSHNYRSDKHSLIGSPIKEPMNCNFPYCVDTFPIEISWCRTWIKGQKMSFMVSFIFSECVWMICVTHAVFAHTVHLQLLPGGVAVQKLQMRRWQLLHTLPLCRMRPSARRHTAHSRWSAELRRPARFSSRSSFFSFL